MKNLCKLIGLLIYSIVLFWINNMSLIILIVIFNFFIKIVLKLESRKIINNLIILSPFIIFTFIINVLCMSFHDATLIAIRLILVCNMMYMFQYCMSSLELSTSIELLFVPLKIFRINTSNVGLIVNIAITFIPIFLREYEQIRYSLKSKGGLKKKYKIIENIQNVSRPYFYTIFKRTNDIEYALKIKGVVEE